MGFGQVAIILIRRQLVDVEGEQNHSRKEVKLMLVSRFEKSSAGS